MKLITMNLLLILSFSALGKGHSFHVPLELSLEESLAWNKILSKNRQKNLQILSPSITISIRGGEKMNKWLNLINKKRSDENKIRLTSKKTQRGIPLDKPSVYGPASIKEDLVKLQHEMPQSLYTTFYGSTPIPETLNVSDEEFKKWAKKTSKLYQTAVRWKGMQRWLPQLTQRKTQDVRGYYFLKNLDDIDATLRAYRSLNNVETLKKSLVGICINSLTSKERCERDLERAIKRNKLIKYKNKYWKMAVSNWDSFFEISDPRRDVEWSESTPNVMSVVFKKISDRRVSDWLKDNVEDEFQRPSLSWNLEMTYIDGSSWPLTAYLDFKPNVTPHVSGGNKIVMDANTDIEEFGVRWTIRHEFGHILRLPDCYHEFYDKEQNAMVNYQLDTTDLMCSRAGSMNDRIYNELKRVYLK